MSSYVTKDWKRFFDKPFKSRYQPHLRFVSQLRYGENHRSTGLLYDIGGPTEPLAFSKNWTPVGPFNFEDDVSMIAIIDFERATRTALQIACAFEVNFNTIPHIAVGVKHGNACGAGVGKTPKEALVGLVVGSGRALFGGTVVTNFTLDEEGAELLHTYQNGEHKTRRPMAGVAAPLVTEGVVDELHRKSRKFIAFQNPVLGKLGVKLLSKRPVRRMLPLLGLEIVQQPDTFILNFKDERMRYEGEYAPFQVAAVLRDLALAWAVCSTSSSNTITMAEGGKIVANAVGGQDRASACEAAGRALGSKNLHVPGLVAASDSFFPFTDGVLALKRYGADTFVTTSGSERDREIAAFVRDNHMSMMWIDDKIARGFFGH